MKHKRIISLGIVGILGLLRPGYALAVKNELRLQVPQKASQEREDYQQCVASVIKKYKPPRTAKFEKKMQAALAICRDRYPAASILAECKKQMTLGYADQADVLKAGLKECRNEYKKYAFNPKSAVPIAVRDDKAFFAGMGMNEPTLVKESEEDETPSAQYMSENFGNFSCVPVHQSMFENARPEYTLFGNDPLLYAPLRNVSREAFLKGIGYPKATPPPASFISKDFGEITYDADTKSFLNYPPSSYCFFNRKIGTIYESIKLYYLLDRESKNVVPYFGVGFYKDKTVISAKKLAEEFVGRLGTDYKVTEARPGIFMIATHTDFDVDAEGDPKNLCQNHSDNPYLAIIKSRPSSDLAAYSLFANTANLCRFGDRVASRFLKRKSLAPTSGNSAE